MNRPCAIAMASALVLAMAGCGSGATSGTDTSTTSTAAPPGSLEALWRQEGEDVAAIPGTSDYGVGRNRISFLVVDKQQNLVERPTARVWISHDRRQKPFAETTATLEPIGIPGGAKADAQNIYVAHVTTPTPGTYWILAEPVGGKKVQAIRDMVVHRRPSAPAVGDRAIPSRNPTLGPNPSKAAIRAATTAEPPDLNLLRTTVAASMAAHRPFVVTFATPQFCQTATCGPVVQVVQSVAKKWQPKGVDFIHIEIYKDNDPSKGTNRWVEEWKLKSEPFTFVVDRKGIVRTRLEGAMSPGELDAAVSQVAP